MIKNKSKWHLKHCSNEVTPYHHSKVPFFSLLQLQEFPVVKDQLSLKILLGMKKRRYRKAGHFLYKKFCFLYKK